MFLIETLINKLIFGFWLRFYDRFMSACLNSLVWFESVFCSFSGPAGDKWSYGTDGTSGAPRSTWASCEYTVIQSKF